MMAATVRSLVSVNDRHLFLFFLNFILKAFSSTPETAREWLRSSSAPLITQSKSL